MELIPILATIILVATITTFFLSIGAYVLFKVRERKGVRVAASPQTSIKAELVTPESEQIVTHESLRPAAQQMSSYAEPVYRASQESVSGKEQYAPMQAAQTPGAQQFSGFRDTGSRLTIQPSTNKFARASKEQQKKEADKKTGAVKWR